VSTCWTATKPFTTAQAVLAAAETALVPTAGGRPLRVVCVPGAEVAWDECDCGTLSLAVTNRYVSRSFPTSAADLPTNCCDTYIVYEMALSIVRCVPGPGANGTAPGEAQLTASLGVQEEDAFVLWTTVECVLAGLYRPTGNETIAGFILNDSVSLGPSGNCAGTELHFKVGWTIDCACG
jgi:hypothetical protein